MENFALLIPIIAILMPVFIVGIVFYFRSRERTEMQKTLRMAIEKGQPLPPEYLDSLKKIDSGPVKSPRNDIRSGLILIAVAGGLCVMDYINGDYGFGGLSGVAAIPGFIGVALLILGLFGLGKSKS